MMPLIECVPNISEGRRGDVVTEITDALSRVPGAALLDASSDFDHNRTVLTLAGTPTGLKTAVLTLYEIAVRRIDLRQHAGAHPRMGAVDVVPFVPLRGAAMPECVALAREVGQEVAERFGVPVFLYADAAAQDNRRVLSAIRRGGFEGMAAKMGKPAWMPDFGPASPHPSAGVSAIGARFFLVAYNIQLDTPSLDVAKAVARAVRESSGGLQHVQAMGVFLAGRNQAQVSMNLLHYEKTPLHRVQELVRVEAARHGARIVGSEIVGLVPQTALLDAAAFYLQVENWNPQCVLENAVQRKMEDTGPE